MQQIDLTRGVEVIHLVNCGVVSSASWHVVVIVCVDIAPYWCEAPLPPTRDRLADFESGVLPFGAWWRKKMD